MKKTRNAPGACGGKLVKMEDLGRGDRMNDRMDDRMNDKIDNRMNAFIRSSILLFIRSPTPPKAEVRQVLRGGRPAGGEQAPRSSPAPSSKEASQN